MTASLESSRALEDEKLPRKLILKKKKEIALTLKKGFRINGRYLRIVLYNKSINFESNFKVAFLVSKRMGKRAVLRNRVKRWLREIFRKNKALFNKFENIILTVIVPYDQVNFDLLKNDFENIVKSEKFNNQGNQDLPK